MAAPRINIPQQSPNGVMSLLPIAANFIPGVGPAVAASLSAANVLGAPKAAPEKIEVGNVASNPQSALDRYKGQLDEHPINQLYNAQNALAQLPDDTQRAYKPYLDAAMDAALKQQKKLQEIA